MIYQRRTDHELAAAIDALNQYLGDCVEIVRVIVNADGIPVERISRGFVYMPGYVPPAPTPVERLLATKAKAAAMAKRPNKAPSSAVIPPTATSSTSLAPIQ